MSGSMSISGISSGLDTDSIIEKMMEYYSKNKEAIEADKAVAETQLTVWQSLSVSVLALNTACGSIADAADFQTNVTSSSNESILKASASSSAKTGTYYLSVKQLAQVHQVACAETNTYSSTNDVVGTGTVSFTFANDPTKDFTVTIDENNNTLSGLCSAINKADKGIQASMINIGTESSPKYQLLLTSEESGEDSQFSVSTDLTGGTAPDLSRVVQEGQNALISFGSGENAIEVEKSTNKVTDLISGVTLNLESADSSKMVTVSVSRDTDTIESAISDFVDQYNSLMSAIAEQFTYDADSEESGTLFGDYKLQVVQQDIMSAISGIVSGLESDFTSLSAIGITHDEDGYLQIDDETLSEALEENPDAVGRLFSAGMDSDSTYVTYAASTSNTKATGNDWAVNITQPATQAWVTSGTEMSSTLGADETLTVKGTDIQLQAGWDIDRVVQEINSYSSTTGVTVSATGADGTGTGNYLTFKSVRYGSSASFTLKSNVSYDQSYEEGCCTGIGTILISPTSTDGEKGSEDPEFIGYGAAGNDVAGTVNGATCTGSGQILTVKDDNNDANGLSLVITGSSALTTSVTFTQGIGDKLRALLNEMTSSTGIITQAEDTLNTKISDYEDQIADEEERITNKQDQLYEKFNEMEAKLSELKSQGDQIEAFFSDDSSDD